MKDLYQGVKWVDIDSLIPYESNAKIHDDRQIANVANSLKRFGWKQPIVVDKDNVIIIGHCRLLAARKLGMEQVPVFVADGLTDEEVRELRVADNKLNESPWDFERLKEDIKGLGFDGFDFGFDKLKTEVVEEADIEDEPIQVVEEQYVCPRCGCVFTEAENEN